jgi:hypothetical protein
MIVQAKGQPAVIVPTTTQTPKAIIPAEIRNESTISMIGPLSSERKQKMAWNLSIYPDRYVARDSISTSIEIPARTLRSRGAGRYSARRGCHRRVDDLAAQQQLFSAVHLPAQRVDATQALNLSAGVSNCKVSRGRSFS